MNKDQKLLAEAYESGVWNKDVKHAQGYKVDLDHIHVRLYSDDGKEKVYQVIEHTKDNKQISRYYYQPEPEGWNDDPDMVLTSMDISKILSDDIKKEVRRQVEEIELDKMGLNKETKDDWRGILTNL